MEDSIRAFIAFELPPHVKSGIFKLISNFKQENLNIKWVEEKNLHITLKFFGNISQNKLFEIKRVTEKTVKNIKPPLVNISELGAFPSVKNARVLWVGAKEKSENIIKNIFSSLEKEYSKIGIPRENNRFHPHITIGRVRKIRLSVSLLFAKYSNFINYNDIMLNKITIFKSVLTKRGAIYEPLFTFNLDKMEDS